MRFIVGLFNRSLTEKQQQSFPTTRNRANPPTEWSVSLRRAGTLISMVLAIGAPIGIPPANASSAAPSARAQVLMVYGDSLSAAYGIKPEQGWVALMANQLAAEPTAAKRLPLRVVNASISGETSRGGLSRIGVDLKRHQPTHVLIALGANDGLRGLPVKDTVANLTSLVAAVRAANAQPILVGIQIPPNYGTDYARDFQLLFPTLARAQKLPFVPFLLDGIADNLDLFQADRLHPTAAAQPRILQNVLPVVRATLSRPKSAK